MDLGALPEDLQKVIQALTENKSLECVVLYGSFARGQPHKESDIDLAFAAKTGPLPAEDYLKILSQISSLTDRKVDLADLHKSHPPFLQEVFRDGVWFKKNNKVYFNILRRCLYEVEDFLPLRKKILEEKLKRFVGDS